MAKRGRNAALLPAVPMKFKELLEGVLKVKPPAKATATKRRKKRR